MALVVNARRYAVPQYTPYDEAERRAASASTVSAAGERLRFSHFGRVSAHVLTWSIVFRFWAWEGREEEGRVEARRGEEKRREERRGEERRGEERRGEERRGEGEERRGEERRGEERRGEEEERRGEERRGEERRGEERRGDNFLWSSFRQRRHLCHTGHGRR